MIYFTPDAPPAYAAIGISSPRAGYFLSRSAAMGAVSADVVIATFFNFHPGLVRRAMDNGWATAAPDAVTAARLDAVDASLRRAFGSELLESAVLGRAADLSRRAALVASEHREGRPLFAGHSVVAVAGRGTPRGLARPDVAARVPRRRTCRRVDACRPLGSRRAAVARRLRRRAGRGPACDAEGGARTSGRPGSSRSRHGAGFVDGAGAFTDAGLAQRQQIEDATDRAALVAYEALTDDEADEVVAIGRMLTERVGGGRSAAGRSVALRRLLTAPAVGGARQVRGRADGQPADMPRGRQPGGCQPHTATRSSGSSNGGHSSGSLEAGPSCRVSEQGETGVVVGGHDEADPVAGRSHAAPALRRSR